jgi:hypothetical protein
VSDEERYRISSSAFIVAGLLLAIGLIGAGWILGSQIKETRLGDRYVTVKGLAERTVKSDLAIWNISFRSSGDDFKTVLAAGDSQRQMVLAFLKKQGVAENEITIGAPNVIDREAQEYSAVQGRQSRYILSQSIIVTSTNVDQVAAASQKIGELLQQGVILASSPGVSGSQLAYKFNGLNSIKPDMITEATKNARSAAERFAQDSGAKVGTIRQASQGNFSISAANAGSQTDDGGYNNPDSSIIKMVRVVTSVEYYLSQ